MKLLPNPIYILQEFLINRFGQVFLLILTSFKPIFIHTHLYLIAFHSKYYFSFRKKVLATAVFVPKSGYPISQFSDSNSPP
jgi:hypothetical protein